MRLDCRELACEGEGRALAARWRGEVIAARCGEAREGTLLFGEGAKEDAREREDGKCKVEARGEATGEGDEVKADIDMKAERYGGACGRRWRGGRGHRGWFAARTLA